GYTPTQLPNNRYALKRDDGTLVPITFTDYPPILGSIKRHSYLADLPLDDIAASYKHPHAYPLYHDYLATTPYFPRD
uniref:hypothetical protein n=1 Tax=Schaalia suimastitidis TaxID=121163 RepID=UPI00047D01BE